MPPLRSMSTDLEPEEVMLLLHELFMRYDELADKWGVYKVGQGVGGCVVGRALSYSCVML